MTTLQENVLDVLKLAQKRVVAGWCQGYTVRADGCVCAAGAIIHSTPGSPANGQHNVLFATYQALADAIPGGQSSPLTPDGAVNLITRYNDQPEQTQADIVTWFGDAIQAQEALVAS